MRPPVPHSSDAALMSGHSFQGSLNECSRGKRRTSSRVRIGPCFSSSASDAHRHEPLIQHLLDVQARPVAQAEAHGGLNFGAVEVDELR